MSEEKMSNKEPTEKEIRDYMEKHNKNYYNAREILRDLAYKDTHTKPVGMDWGIYWKTY